MAFQHIHSNPSDRQLRQFGLIALVALPVLGYLWTGNNLFVLGWASGIGAVVAIMAWIRPRWLTPLFIGLSFLALPIGWLVSEVLLLATFFCLFWPIGFLRRRFGGDPLQRHLDRQAETYWQPKSQPGDVSSYFRQS